MAAAFNHFCFSFSSSLAILSGMAVRLRLSVFHTAFCREMSLGWPCDLGTLKRPLPGGQRLALLAFLLFSGGLFVGHVAFARTLTR